MSNFYLTHYFDYVCDLACGEIRCPQVSVERAKLLYMFTM